MKVEVDRSNPEKFVIAVVVPRSKVEAEITALAEKRRPNISLPGFRRGTVPLDIIQKQMGAQLRNEVSLFFVNSCTEEAIRTEGLHNSGFPELLDDDRQSKSKKWLGRFSLDGSFSFKIALEPPPSVEITDVESIEYSVNLPEIQDYVERKLRENRLVFAQRETVATPVEVGNEVVADMEAFLGGAAVVDGKSENVTFVIGAYEYFKELEDDFVGKVVGDVFDTTVVFPSNHPQQIFAGKTLTFKSTLKEVRKINLHPENDELAQMLSHENLDALKDFYRAQAEEDVGSSTRAKRFHAIRTKMVEKYPFKIPSGWVENEEKIVCQRLGMDYAKVKDKGTAIVSTQEDKDVWKSIVETAETNVRTAFLLDKIFDEKDLDIEESDMVRMTHAAAQRFRITPEQYIDELRRVGQYDAFIQQVQQEKTVDWLIANTKQVENNNE